MNKLIFKGTLACDYKYNLKSAFVKLSYSTPEVALTGGRIYSNKSCIGIFIINRKKGMCLLMRCNLNNFTIRNSS
jgi:hypothetical protein